MSAVVVESGAGGTDASEVEAGGVVEARRVVVEAAVDRHRRVRAVHREIRIHVVRSAATGAGSQDVVVRHVLTGVETGIGSGESAGGRRAIRHREVGRVGAHIPRGGITEDEIRIGNGIGAGGVEVRPVVVDRHIRIRSGGGDIGGVDREMRARGIVGFDESGGASSVVELNDHRAHQGETASERECSLEEMGIPHCKRSPLPVGMCDHLAVITVVV